MNILFLHFPIDNNQIESKTLPDFFATKDHNVYSCFEKGKRNFYSQHSNSSKLTSFSSKEALTNINFDVIISKNDSFQKYGKIFKNNSTIVINVSPMGFKHNYQNCNYYFKEDEIIKAPIPEMQHIFDNEYISWDNRQNQIIVPGTIGSDKNQKEIVDFVNKDIINNYSFLFAGKIYNDNYANYLYQTLASKNIKCEFKFLSRTDLAREYLKSKLTMLTTDPRPIQPFDPGPRVIFESIRAGTPCIVNDLIKINKYCLPYCKVYKNKDILDFNNKMYSFFNDSHCNISKKCYMDGRRYLTIEYACKDAYERIMSLI